MPIQLISIGPPAVLTQNVVYALPAKPSVLTTSLACETSINGTTWVAHTSGNITSSKFVRCTTGSPTVVCATAVAGAGGGGSLPADAAITSSLSIGAIPALTGHIRLPDQGTISARNGANNADKLMMKWNGSSTLEIAEPGADTFIKGNIYCGGNALNLNPSTNTADGGRLQITARTTANPTVQAGTGLLWVKNVGGKMALMISFPTGTPVQLAIEP